MRRYIAMLVFCFATVGCATQRDPESIVSLRQDFAGAGARSWELRLKSDGSVVEEREDIFARVESEIYKTKLIRVVPASDIDVIRTKAAEMISVLPEYLDNGRIEVDPESKAIRVQVEGKEEFAGWASYEDTVPTSETEEFERVWEEIKTLLLGVDG